MAGSQLLDRSQVQSAISELLDVMQLGGGHRRNDAFAADLLLAAEMAPDPRDVRADLLKRVNGLLAEGTANLPQPSLFHGFLGRAWTISALTTELDDDADVDDPLADVDEVLRDLLIESSRFPWGFDLISGLTGAGVYALRRLPRRSAVECAQHVVRRLWDARTTTRSGVTWVHPQRQRGERSFTLSGFASPSVAHGTSGVISLLARCWANGIERDVCEALIGPGSRWVIRSTTSAGEVRRIPMRVDVTESPAGPYSHPFWCYGALGIAAAFEMIGAITGEEGFTRHADVYAHRGADLALQALNSARHEAPVAGFTSLCHGVAGAGYLLLGMRSLSDPYLRDVGARCFAHIVGSDLRKAHVVGDAARDPLLTGPAGTALALQSALTRERLPWGSLLLVRHEDRRI